MAEKFDHFDFRILEELQRDAAQSQRALAERIGLSQNACWRRLKALEASGAIRNRTVRLTEISEVVNYEVWGLTPCSVPDRSINTHTTR